MKKNMGTTDRVVRTVAALGIAALYFTGRISGVWAVVLGIVAVAFLLTSTVGWCPVYAPFGISTRKGPDTP